MKNSELTILIADDDPISRVLLVNWANRSGYTVLSAPDGKHASDLLRAYRVDIGIFDWDMPYRTSIELCRRVRSTRGNAPQFYETWFTRRGGSETL